MTEETPTSTRSTSVTRRYRFERARADQIPRIVEIARQLRLRSPEDSHSRESFLVSGFEQETYERLIHHAEHFWVALERQPDGSDHLAGFLVAYASTSKLAAPWVRTYLIQRYAVPTVIVKQIAVAPEARRRGLARRLYENLLHQTREQRVAAAIVLDPPNRPSEALHRRLGFKRVYDHVPADGFPRALYVRESACEEKTLAQQYEMANLLYMHEDQLNWNKLRSLLWVTAALFSVFGFLWQQGQRAIPGLPADYGFFALLGLCLLGLLISIGYAIAIHSGVRYLMNRKNSVCDIEDRMRGVHTVALSQRKAPTAYVLQSLPIALGLLWAAAILGILFLKRG